MAASRPWFMDRCGHSRFLPVFFPHFSLFLGGDNWGGGGILKTLHFLLTGSLRNYSTRIKKQRTVTWISER